MRFCVVLICVFLTAPALLAQTTLPFATVFRGEAKFHELVAQAERENWRALPLNERIGKVGLALRGTHYENYTLEIDDSIEAPSVDLDGLDCWTFFETCLGFARMLHVKSADYTPDDLLAAIETDRYISGQCRGYLSRLHFLEQWSADNEARGLVRNITQELGGVRMDHRDLNEMTSGFRSYRYLRSNPSLLTGIARVQEKVSNLPVYYLPKNRVAAAESRLQTGDIICIVSADPNAYTSHVGLAYRDPEGLLHFMHATSSYDKGRKVIVDGRLSDYLQESASRLGGHGGSAQRAACPVTEGQPVGGLNSRTRPAPFPVIMSPETLRQLLESVRTGELSTEQAFAQCSRLPGEDLGFARLDHHRELRTGLPEVIYGAGKTDEQVLQIFRSFARQGGNVFTTRVSVGAAQLVQEEFPAAQHHSLARTPDPPSETIPGPGPRRPRGRLCGHQRPPGG